MGRPRGMIGALAVTVIAGVGVIWYGFGTASVPTAAPSPSPALSSAPPAAPSPSAVPSVGPSSTSPSPAAVVVTAVPARGTGKFDFSGTGAARVGGAGRLVRYTVGTEQGSGVDPEDFAAAVHATLSDPRSWIAGARFSFQRVPAGQPSELTVHLATPGTTDTMCAKRGVRTRGEVSCRGGRDVIINLKRWQLGVAWYPRLADYRDMVVNHEVGHFLGNGHVVCPRKGAPAPVMARQTFGLEGCVQNPWPYPDGRTYVTGPAAPR
ncbi:DUF3152 domain-containing protein [Dactylosporangium siamense]|uniref:DUF3152 domain-containing protein n=1 Tax=Dactylosporangium siamense TaxID=685454 RepID=UPI001941A10D|nr:DUF3152 domain-containing protein [Dactylosporangium siamense]